MKKPNAGLYGNVGPWPLRGRFGERQERVHPTHNDKRDIRIDLQLQMLGVPDYAEAQRRALPQPTITDFMGESGALGKGQEWKLKYNLFSSAGRGGMEAERIIMPPWFLAGLESLAECTSAEHVYYDWDLKYFIKRANIVKITVVAGLDLVDSGEHRRQRFLATVQEILSSVIEDSLPFRIPEGTSFLHP